MSAPTSWESFPLLLNTEHIALLLDISVDTVRKHCAKRSILFQPLRWKAPYRWSRDVVRASLENRMPAPTVGRASRRSVVTPAPRVVSRDEYRAARESLTRDLGGLPR